MPLSDPQALVDGAAKWRRRMSSWLIGANIAVALLLAVLVGVVLDRSHRATQEQATNVADGLAAVARLNIQSEIDKVDAVIRATTAELERLLSAPDAPSDARLNALLQSDHEVLDGVEAIRLTDADGQVRWGTGLPPGPPLNVADRDYFAEASRLKSPATVIAGPLTSRVSGHWVVAFMRPLQVRGRFAGIVYVSIATAHFQRLFERYDLEPQDAVTLRRNDHRLVARFSPGSAAQGQTGDATVSAPLAAALAANPRSGSFVSRVLVDGQERTTAYRAIDGWPFVVYAGINNERFFTSWRHEAATVIALAAVAWLLVAAAAWIVHRAYGREKNAMQVLADQGKRVQALLRASGDGIHITDSKGRLVEMSDSFAEMLHSTRAELLGRHISSWDANQDEAAVSAWLATLKPGGRQRVDVQHRRDDGELIEVELQLSAAEIGGELLVFAAARDVTAVRQLMREQALMLDNDLVGMVKVADRRISWRNRAAERILGYAPGELLGQPVRQVYWDEAGYRRVGVEGYAALAERGHYRSQIQMRRKSGEPVWIDFSAVPLSDKELFAMLVDITAMKAAHEELAHAACHDALTELPNRLLLNDRLGHALALARREQHGIAVCYLDLDGFKAVNDGHGHDAGDQLLRAVAARLLANLRASDTAARLGGDEFVLVLPGLAGDEWRPVLDRVIEAIAAPIVLADGATVAVSATAGVAVCAAGDDEVGAQELLERADQAMLRGKRRHKGQVFVD